jgi:hypothetical protein
MGRMNYCHLRGWRFRFAAFVLISGLAQAAFAGEEPARSELPLKLTLYTPLDIDGNATTASTTLQLSNPNPAEARYSLVLHAPAAKNTKQPANWVVTFYSPDSKPAGQTLEGTIPGRSAISVRMDLANVIEAGETDAELQSFGTRIGTITLMKVRGLPFRIFLEGNPSEKPDVTLVNGKPVELHLKNDDPMHYPVECLVTVKGKTVKGSRMLGPDGSTMLAITPDPDWFSWFEGLFKSEQVDGTLRVGYKPDNALDSFPSKTIPFRAHLDPWDSHYRDLAGMIIMLVILAVGGLFSVYVNIDLVNRIKAFSVRKRLGQLARTTGEIQPQLSSQLRVSLWLERGRIESTLPDRILFTPEAASALTQSDGDVDALQLRVDSASKIADASIHLDHVKDSGIIAPSLCDQVSRNLLAAQDLLKRSLLSAEEWQRVQSLVGEAGNLLAAVGQPDDNLEKVLATRTADLNARFTPAFQAKPLCGQIRAQIPIPFNLLDPAAWHGSQADRDANSRKLSVIGDMIDGGLADPEIIRLLQRQDSVSLPMAEQLLMELKNGVSFADLTAEITANPPRVYFTIDRDTVRVDTPIMMKLMFNELAYNRAAAKQRLIPNWSFAHNNLTEKGWEVHHYFPQVQPYMVTVTFMDVNQNPIATPAPVQYQVQVSTQRGGGGASWWTELQRWAVGFVFAVLGLFVVARDKILTLDTLSAIVAVFLLGFGIDMARTVLGPKQ